MSLDGVNWCAANLYRLNELDEAARTDSKVSM